MANERGEGEGSNYGEVDEIDNGPGGASFATENGDDGQPGEEDDEDVSGPDARVLEPRGVLVSVGRRNDFHV